MSGEPCNVITQEEMAMPETPIAPCRKDNIFAQVKAVLEDVAGLAPEEINGDATFLDLGLDSLFLTQASMAFKKKFRVPVTFRQLLEDSPTPSALVDYLDQKLPPDTPPVPQAAAVVAPPPSQTGTPGPQSAERVRTPQVSIPEHIGNGAGTAVDATTG